MDQQLVTSRHYSLYRLQSDVASLAPLDQVDKVGGVGGLMSRQRKLKNEKDH